MLRNFRLNIIVRVTIIVVFAILLSVGADNRNYLLMGGAFVLLTIAVTNLIQYVNQTNKNLANFFTAIKYNDFTTNTSTTRQGAHFEDLQESFNLINRKFRSIRAEKEANHQFLQTLVQHVDIGLLCVDGNGEVILMNNALQKLLRKSYLINLNALKKIDEQLWTVINDLKDGSRELLKVNIQNHLLQLSIQAVDITLQKEPFRLISFQNIQSELEAQELLAWQKLIRILTHEIMNSVAPISSLSSTINNMLNQADNIEQVQLETIKKSLAVIHKRSEGLLDFTETYRTLTRIPPPKFQIVDLQILVEEVETLMDLDIRKYNIQLIKEYDTEKIQIKGDPHLLEQVLINLLKNAIEACKEQPTPKIELHVFSTQDYRSCIQIKDNGIGIPADKLEQIFVPFFTTKAEGSGVGLSLSRQILRMHKGNIDIQSQEGVGTVVSVYL